MRRVISNDFHGTACAVNAPADIGYGDFHIDLAALAFGFRLDNTPSRRAARARIRRIRRALCGVDGCQCGDTLGASGKQDW